MGSTQKLVIVESPTKARTIRKYLGPGYRVEASMGHIRDLPANASEIPAAYKKESWARIGVNTDDDFKPIYVVSKDKKSVVTELKKALKDADELYIATDEDREGEAIGWHLLEVLKPKVPTHRMVFHEITKGAIQKALTNTRELDMQLVNAQEARRILDRLVGYKVSPLLWKKITSGISAGRVQSVAVRMLVLRERERIAFVKGSYWGIKATIDSGKGSFGSELQTVDGTRVAIGRDFDENTGKVAKDANVLLLEETQAKALASALQNGNWSVQNIERKESNRRAYPPFTTSTLQQEANRKLGMSARDTMRTAQNLYEQGHITYMRTDSVNLSTEAISASRDRIARDYGNEYLTAAPKQFSTTSKGAQEAHEAIRPAGTQMATADEIGVSGRERALYELIWKRTIATQMADARIANTTATILAETADGTQTTFRASGREVVFAGFLRAYVEGSDDPEKALDDQNAPLPPMTVGQKLKASDITPEGHETRPPARYTEASLVKALEANGIGRPSTFASIISTIQHRGYVNTNQKQLVPTFLAMAVIQLLEQTHTHILDFEFTAEMENDLDALASTEDTLQYLRRIYDDQIMAGMESGEDLDPKEISTLEYDELDPIAVRVGKYGPYLDAPPQDGEDAPRRASIPEELAPADLTKELADELLQQAARGDEPLGTDPQSGKPVYVLNGRFGPYIRCGDPEDEEKPKTVSLPKEVDPLKVDFNTALQYLGLPRNLGEHPESGNAVEVLIGRYGPYIREGKNNASLKKTDDVLTIELERALQLLKEKGKRGAGREPLRVVGEHPDGGEIGVFDGRFGPYVKYGKVNATIPKGQDPDTIDLETAVELIKIRAEKMAAAPKKKKAAPKKKATTTKTTTKAATKTTAKTASKTATKKATTTKTAAKKTTTKTAAAKTDEDKA